MIFKHLALEMPDDEAIERAERLTDYEYLLGESGVATTPLRPAGKAKFGNEFVQVISDGTPLSTGDAVRVIEVKGNRVVVAPVE
jgi:membrane-bound ClpP family serine protease